MWLQKDSKPMGTSYVASSRPGKWRERTLLVPAALDVEHSPAEVGEHSILMPCGRGADGRAGLKQTSTCLGPPHRAIESQVERL